MPSVDPETVIHQLIVGDAGAVGQMVAEAQTSEDPTILVVAALLAPGADALLDRAARIATTTRDRQLVSIAAAYLAGDRDLVDALARDHLVDHPDNVLVAWIAARNQALDTRKDPS